MPSYPGYVRPSISRSVAAAHRDRKLQALEVKRLAQPFKDTRCDRRGIGLTLDIAEEDSEFVSADARHNRLPRATPVSTGADAGPQPSRDIDE